MVFAISLWVVSQFQGVLWGASGLHHHISTLASAAISLFLSEEEWPTHTGHFLNSPLFLNLIPPLSCSQALAEGPENIAQLPWPWDIGDSVRHLRFFSPATYFSSRREMSKRGLPTSPPRRRARVLSTFYFPEFICRLWSLYSSSGPCQRWVRFKFPFPQRLAPSISPCCCSSPFPHPPLETLV